MQVKLINPPRAFWISPHPPHKRCYVHDFSGKVILETSMINFFRQCCFYQYMARPITNFKLYYRHSYFRAKPHMSPQSTPFKITILYHIKFDSTIIIRLNASSLLKFIFKLKSTSTS